MSRGVAVAYGWRGTGGRCLWRALLPVVCASTSDLARNSAFSSVASKSLKPYTIGGTGSA